MPDVWRAILLIALFMNTGCSARRPDFITRVQEDCVAGDKWACDLLDSLSHPKPDHDIQHRITQGMT
jgi:hypothetical protein